MALTYKKIDKSGRITIGAEFANQLARVQQVSGSEFRVTLGEFVPKDEAWLHQNRQALDMVREGLAAAEKGDFVEGPNLDDDEE